MSSLILMLTFLSTQLAFLVPLLSPEVFLCSRISAN